MAWLCFKKKNWKSERYPRAPPIASLGPIEPFGRLVASHPWDPTGSLPPWTTWRVLQCSPLAHRSALGRCATVRINLLARLTLLSAK